jgi:hypothetical protein
MLTNKYTKTQMVKHIRHLFRGRQETFRPTGWDCILRNGQLMIIRSYLREPTDQVIMHCFLASGQLPSLLSTCSAVHRNWPVLTRATIETPVASDVGSPTPTGDDVRIHREEEELDGPVDYEWIINHEMFH